MALDETQASSPYFSHKRERDDEDDHGVVVESAEAKRLKAELLLDILDEDDDDRAGDAVADGETTADDLATVMRSLEEEIGLASPADEHAEVSSWSGSCEDDFPQPELGFLFEASDDELGLPPTSGDAAEDEVGPPFGETTAVFGQISEYEEDAPGGYDAFDFGLEGAAAGYCGAAGLPGEADQDGVLFHGGLFDDYLDIWRPESLPAV